ncbi:MAG TPA: hypothetical protein VI704_04060, partial [Bacteroidota bacterium]|nr:hypothetical protein [Bacteroidota bacterium]
MKETKTILLLSLFAYVATAQYVTVPADHQVYPLLVKGETLGMFDSYQLRVLPLTRNDVISLLNAMKRNTEMLSTADTELLGQMLGEFTNLNPGEPASSENEIHAYRYEEGSTQLFLDLRGVGEVDVHRGQPDLPDENLLKMTGFGSIRGQFGDRIFVGLSARNGMTLGKKNSAERFDVGKGETQSVVGSSIFTD